MKHLIILLIAIFSFGTTFGQLSGGYEFVRPPGEFNYHISFSKKGQYSLIIANELCSMIFMIPFSDGRYTVKNNQITFRDMNHGFVMKASLISSGKKILINKGFAFLNGDTAIWYREEREWEFPISGKGTILQKKEREAYLQQHKHEYPIRYETYEGEYNWQPTIGAKWEKGYDYELNIQKNHQYTLHYYRRLILKGTWSRNGNEIALYDESLQHTFYLLVGKDELISKYLPGGDNSPILKHEWQWAK